MQIYSIIPYWINKKTGESRVNKKWLCLKVGNSYKEVYEWAQENKDYFKFRADEVYKVNEINDSNLVFDFSIKEISDICITDINDNEYMVDLNIKSKIEIKRIEIPIS